MKKPDTPEPDTVGVEDKNVRRRFIRTGAAFLLAGGAVAQAQEESEMFRTDCDSQGGGGPKDAEVAGNDTDAGATADRPGCGRRKPPAMTEYNNDGPKKFKVAKVEA